MIGILLLLLQAAPVAGQQEIAPMPPTDWTALPILRFRRPPGYPPELATFVRGEVKAGRCAHAQQTTQGWNLKIDLAVLATPAGQARRVVPRAIDCPTVEQYASGLVSRMARDNIDAAGAPAETWYRTSMAFAWDE